jgi:hypothetical protein
MLKLHHMNLLNEIQETTLMMNLYQQQQLQQQQQQLEQQASSQDIMRTNDPMSTMFHNQNSNSATGLDQMFGAAQLQRSSLGLGGPQLGGGSSNFNEQQFQMMQQLNQMNSGPGNASVLLNDSNQQDLDSRVAQLKEDIARREQAENFNRGGSGGGNKRSNDDGKDESMKKRIKADVSKRNNDGSDDDDDDDDDSLAEGV